MIVAVAALAPAAGLIIYDLAIMESLDRCVRSPETWHRGMSTWSSAA